jgi:hypothetical protein
MALKKTKMEIVQLIKELVKLSNVPDPSVAIKIKGIVKRIMNQTIDFHSTLNYITINLKTAKRPESKAVWANVATLIRDYLNDNKL